MKHEAFHILVQSSTVFDRNMYNFKFYLGSHLKRIVQVMLIFVQKEIWKFLTFSIVSNYFLKYCYSLPLSCWSYKMFYVTISSILYGTGHSLQFPFLTTSFCMDRFQEPFFLEGKIFPSWYFYTISLSSHRFSPPQRFTELSKSRILHAARPPPLPRLYSFDRGRACKAPD